jgi:hypothetical protein
MRIDCLPMEDSRLKRRNITITEQLDKRKTEASKKTGLSVSDILRRAAEDYLDKLESEQGNDQRKAPDHKEI